MANDSCFRAGTGTRPWRSQSLSHDSIRSGRILPMRAPTSDWSWGLRGHAQQLMDECEKPKAPPIQSQRLWALPFFGSLGWKHSSWSDSTEDGLSMWKASDCGQVMTIRVQRLPTEVGQLSSCFRGTPSLPTSNGVQREDCDIGFALEVLRCSTTFHNRNSPMHFSDGEGF